MHWHSQLLQRTAAHSELAPLVFGNIHLSSRNFTTLMAYFQQRKVETNWTGSSWRNKLPTFLWYDMDPIENYASSCWMHCFLCGPSCSYINGKQHRHTDSWVTWLPESWDSEIWSWVPWNSEPRMTVLARTSSSLPNWPTHRQKGDLPPFMFSEQGK
jgi:hypothetical protein